MIAVYARVSTEEQAKHGYSLMDQIRACRRMANSEDIIEYIDDGVSGEILDRPELTRLRRDIAQGLIEKVYCLDPDRLSRKLMNQLILSEEIEKRAELLFINGEYGQTAEGRLFYQLRGAISEFEKAKINERMTRGRREKARQGKVVRDYSIYGYNYDYNTQQLVINQFEAEIVRTIFTLFTSHDKSIKGINGIAEYLTSIGIPTKRSAEKWHRQVVRQILMNRAYIGEFYQNRWNCEGMLSNKFKEPDKRVPLRARPLEEWILVPCPQIIEQDTFSYSQQLIEESRRRWSGNAKTEYLLSGLIRCKICETPMTGRKSLSWGKQIYEYSDPKSKPGSKKSGCGNRLNAERLDSIIWEKVLEYLRSYEIATKPHLNSSSNAKPDMVCINNRLKEIRNARNNLLNIISLMNDEIGQMGLEDVRQRLKEFKAEEEQLMDAINSSNSNNKNGLTSDPGNVAWNYYIVQNSSLLSFQDRQSIIRNMVKEILADKDEIIIKGF